MASRLPGALRWRRVGFSPALVFILGHDAIAQIAPSFGRPLTDYTTIRLAEGVYAFIAPDSKTALVSGNSLVVIGADAALVVDAAHVPAIARRMIADIRRLTDKPVRYLVNTHWHNDHVFGNAEYGAAFPGLEIISTTPTRNSFMQRVAENRERTIQGLPAAMAQTREILTKGLASNGKPLSASDREYFETEVTDYEGGLAAYREARLAPPTVTFEEEVTLQLGGREVQLKWLGRGNTAGDAVVVLPEVRVVATGDLVVAPTPYAIGSFLHDWPSTMRRLMAIDAGSIVPGHGPIMSDWSYAALVTDLIEVLYRQVEVAVAAGLSLEETRSRVDLAAFRQRLTGGDPFLVRSFDQFFLTPGVARAHREAMFWAER